MIQTNTAALFHPLQRRPEARTVTVRELLQKVSRGELRIPRFQRALRWRPEQVRQLLDSVWRGYPIGSLLFWKRAAIEEEILVGGAKISAPAVQDAWLVVDGQQRITALAATLLELNHRDDRRWTHFFDPHAKEFRSGHPSGTREGVDVPVHVLGDLSRLGRWLRTHHVEDEELVATLEHAQQALLDYAIPVYVVETDDERALRGVFARLNSTGARMRADEVFHALLGGDLAADTTLDLSELAERFSEEGFGSPPRTELLKAVLAMSGLDPTRRPEGLGQEDLTKLVAQDHALEALKSTAAFLAHEVGIRNYRLIPYPVVFTILARFFSLHPEVVDDTETSRWLRGQLRRWVWRGIMQGTHQRGEVSAMNRQIRAIDPTDADLSVMALLRYVDGRPIDRWQLHKFDQRNARSRVEILALLTLSPRDQMGPISDRVIDADERFSREVFRAGRLKTASADVVELAGTAANRVLLDHGNTGLQSWFKEHCSWDTQREILQSHLIDEASSTALQADDLASFLSRRAKQLQALVLQFLLERTEYDEPLLRPISSYLDEAQADASGSTEEEAQ